MMLENETRYQPDQPGLVNEAGDLLPGVILFVDMQKN